jgi:2-polyprenyl-3-methyl-5-hydroxy-6-metoxy-1,4-benzoquinol methylase
MKFDSKSFRLKASKKEKYDYAQIPPGYYDTVFHRNKGVQSKWHQIKFSRLRTHLNGSIHHLDIGCGPGTFIGTLGEELLSVGADISPSQIEYARKRYGTSKKRFEQIGEDLERFQNDLFDIVTMIELIEHLSPEQSERLLKEVLRVLRPGGRLIVSTPNYGGMWPIVEILVNTLGRVSYHHQHVTRYSAAALLDLLRRSGFMDISVSGFMLFAPFAACLGWHFADLVDSVEPKVLDSRWGLLLHGLARKAP